MKLKSLDQNIAKDLLSRIFRKQDLKEFVKIIEINGFEITAFHLLHKPLQLGE